MTDIYGMSEDEREQYLASIGTSIEVADALIDIAEEDGCTFDDVWENGYTPKADADEVLARVRVHIRENVPPEDLGVEYYWGVETVPMGGESPRPDHYQIEGYEVLEKLATTYGTGAHVCVPRGWGGHRVKIIRID